MKIIKTIGGALLLILAAQTAALAQTEKMTADSIRYFLVNALETPKRTAPYSIPGGCGMRGDIFYLEFYSDKASVYSQASYKVLSVYEDEGISLVLLEPLNDRLIVMISNLQKTTLKKGDIIDKKTRIGEAAWNEDEKRYEIELVASQGRKKATREMLETFLEKQK